MGLNTDVSTVQRTSRDAQAAQGASAPMSASNDDIDSCNRTTSGTCTTTTITNWASTISAYIKSIDHNHLVGLGDEGFYNEANGPNYPYQ